MKRILILVLCLALTASAFSSCAVLDTAKEVVKDLDIPSVLNMPTEEPSATPKPATPAPTKTPEPTAPPLPFYEDVEYGDFGSHLNDEGKALYNYFVGGLREYETKFTVYGFTMHQIGIVLDAVFDDWPEFFWLSEGNTITSSTGIYGTAHIVELGTCISPEKAKAVYPETEEAVRALLAQAEGLSDEEAALLFHDALIENTVYDRELYGLTESGPHDENAPEYESFTAYGALVNHKAVCSGYARAFQWLMKERGIPCLYIGGYKNDNPNTGHAWNLVEINGEYGFIDVTSDDLCLVYDDGTEKEFLTHSYFGLSKEDLEAVCTIEDEYLTLSDFDTPSWEYHLSRGFVFDSYDPAAVKTALTAQKGLPSMTIRFTAPEAYDAAFSDLLGNNSILSMISVTEIGCSKNLLTRTLIFLP